MKPPLSLLSRAAAGWRSQVLSLLAVCLTAVPSPLSAAEALTVYPQNSSLEAGSTRQFTAYVPLSNPAIEWLVNDVVGGNATTTGTISPSGLYTPPATIPSPNVVTIKARSIATPTAIGTTSLTLTRKNPSTWSTYPSSVPVGSFQISLNGSNYASDSQVLINGTAVPTIYVSPTSLKANSSAAAAGTLQVSVRNPGIGAVTGNSVPLTVKTAPVTVTVSPTTASVQLGTSQAFTSTVSGTSNLAVTWSITSGSGTISPAGVYTAPATMPASNSVTIRAASVVSPASGANATIVLTLPPVLPSVNLSSARFLEQTSFGPTPGTLAEVAQKGFDQFLADQFAMAPTPIPTPPNNSMGELRTWWLCNATTAPDQLRQRVSYSLSQILVTSSNKLIYPDAMLPWMRLLNSDCFGNYGTLLRKLTVCPSMGKYLDLAGSASAAISGAPNENYPRELMQLFTIGLWQLNQDGTQKLDANAKPIPTYDQATVVEVARALTGWVYANNAYENFTTDLVPSAFRHDTGAKSILGTSIPAGQSVNQDLDAVINILMNHPNTAPFVCTRLIRSLVCSNPSPGYVQRVVTVFNDNGQGIKGDLKAVITAIIMDPEARNDTATATSGRLKEPILNVCGFLRAMNGSFNPNNGLTYLFDYMAQSVLSSPSVFNWFSPLYRLPTNPALFGPEFQIYSPTDCTLRGNMMFTMLNNPAGDVSFDLSPFQPFGSDMNNLVEVVNRTFLYGRMPQGMKTAIAQAAAPGYDAKTRIETVIYFTILSGQYAVQY